MRTERSRFIRKDGDGSRFRIFTAEHGYSLSILEKGTPRQSPPVRAKPPGGQGERSQRYQRHFAGRGGNNSFNSTASYLWHIKLDYQS